MDLTTAIIGLTKAAEGRRLARKALVDATELVAAKIVEEGRAGDAVVVNGTRYEIETLCYFDGRARDKAKTFSAGGDIVLDSRVQYSSNAMGPFCDMHYDGDQQRYWASPATRIAFAKDTPAILAAFAELYRTQAAPMITASESVTRLALA